MKAMEQEATGNDSLFKINNTTRKTVFILLAILCLSPIISPPIALLLGIGVAQLIGHPFLQFNHRATQLLLQVSVIGLGFGINAGDAIKAGKEGVLFTIVSIFGTLVTGYLLGKLLKINAKTSYLVSVGTAICGGSAIAAISPVIKAEEKQMSIALGTVFILNSIALFIFPLIGHSLHLSQMQFGLWCAVAIHDTSSVVGAASKFGNNALQIATTVKLVRTLWIIPIAFGSAFLFKTQNAKIKIPYFIGLFVVMVILNTYVPSIQQLSGTIVHISKAGLTLTLFLIGSSLSRKVLASVGLKPIVQGLILWVMVAVSTLLAILYF